MEIPEGIRRQVDGVVAIMKENTPGWKEKFFNKAPHYWKYARFTGKKAYGAKTNPHEMVLQLCVLPQPPRYLFDLTVGAEVLQDETLKHLLKHLLEKLIEKYDEPSLEERPELRTRAYTWPVFRE